MRIASDVEHKIFYFDGDLSKLKKTPPPEGKEECSAEYRGFTGCRITFQSGICVSASSEAEEVLMDEHEDVLELFQEHQDVLWGQPETFSGDPRQDAYFMRNGLDGLLYNFYKSEEDIKKEAQEARDRGSHEYAQTLEEKVLPQLTTYLKDKESHEARMRDWHLLLKISSIDDAGMCWWDAGYLEFLIDINDLKALNFSNTYADIVTS